MCVVYANPCIINVVGSDVGGIDLTKILVICSGKNHMTNTYRNYGNTS